MCFKTVKYLKSVRKPINGKYLLLCTNRIMYHLLTSYTLNHVFKSFKSLNNEN